MGRNWCRHCRVKGVCQRVRKGILRKRASCDTCLVEAGYYPSLARTVTCSVCFGTAIITDERLLQLTDEVERGGRPLYLADKIKQIESNIQQIEDLPPGSEKKISD